MRKILINIKDAVEILEEFKETLVELREQAEETVKNTKNDEREARISYNPQNKKGFILLAKVHNDIEYIIRIDFVYLDNKVILEVI